MLHEVLLRELVDEPVGCSRGRRNPRAVKRAVSKYPIRHRCKRPLPRVDVGTEAIGKVIDEDMPGQSIKPGFIGPVFAR